MAKRLFFLNWVGLFSFICSACPLTLTAQQYGDFNYAISNNVITITGYTGPGGAVAIPDVIENLPVLSIGDGAFASCQSLTNVTIPNSVTNIGKIAFDSCHNLTNAVIGDNVITIGHYAFAEAGRLASVNIPDKVTTIGDWAFKGCHLTSVTIPKSVTSIGDLAFYKYPTPTRFYFEGSPPTLGGSRVFDSTATLFYCFENTGWGPNFGGLPTVLWNPLMQTRDGSFGVWNNRFGFNITGTTNIPIMLEACTDMSNPNWVPLQSFTLTNGSVYFSNADWTNYPNRFYRVRSP